MENAVVLNKINSELKKLSQNPKNIKDYSRFHKDGKKHIGLVSSLVRGVSTDNYKKVKNLKKEQIFWLCEQLLKNKENDRRTIAFDWTLRIKRQYQKEDFVIFENWIKNYVDTWGSCDDLCTHAFGEFIYKFPEFLPRVKQWTKSPNKWFRRAAAVVLIISLRRGKYLKEALVVAKTLLSDQEDLVQKGFGWTLKEATKTFPKEIFQFVMINKNLMSRTAFRYAIEKLPKILKTKAMNKN